MSGPQQFIGLVTAAKRMPKTITVTVAREYMHPVVGKMIRRRKRMLTHDPKNQANVGDTLNFCIDAIHIPRYLHPTDTLPLLPYHSTLSSIPQPVSAAKRTKLMEIMRTAQVVGGIRKGVPATEEVVTLAGAEKEAASHGVTTSASPQSPAVP